MILVNKGEFSELKVEEALVIQHAASNAKKLAKIPPDRNLKLDLSNVPMMDASGVQLLLSLKKTLGDKGFSVSVTSMSEPVRTVFDICDIVWI